MRTSSTMLRPEHSRDLRQPVGNWMHLTIAPLVEERIASKKSLPGMEREVAPRKHR